MKLKYICTPTKVARPGMLLGEVMKECVDKNVPGIPYIDGEGKVAGRFSVRHMFLLCCVPRDIIQGAHLLGDDLEQIDFPKIKARELMAKKVDDFVFPDAIRLPPDFHAIKALAIMEQSNTEYLFVMDGDEYQGVVTRMGIARVVVADAC